MIDTLVRLHLVTLFSPLGDCGQRRVGERPGRANQSVLGAAFEAKRSSEVALREVGQNKSKKLVEDTY